MTGLITRVGLFCVTLLGVAVLSFSLLHLMPGDPVDVILGEHALAVDKESMRQALGLTRPWAVQLLAFLKGIVSGDWGVSYYEQSPVLEMIVARFGATAKLAAAAMGFALLTSFPLGVWAAVRKNAWQDKFALTFSMAGFSMPSFWLGPVLIIVFSLWLGWFPVSGDDGSWRSLVLPAVTLGTATSAMTARLLRAALLETLGSEYIRTARAKGVPLRRMVWNHALRNAILPVITVVFLQAGALLTGAVLTEAVFSWPGLGNMLVESIHKRDYPVVQGCILFIACVYAAVSLLSDVVGTLLDPRVRKGAELNH